MADSHTARWLKRRTTYPTVEPAPAWIRDASLFESGGGINLDILTLEDGTALVISEDAVCLYASEEAFFDGALAQATLYRGNENAPDPAGYSALQSAYTKAKEITALRNALRNLLRLIEEGDCCPDHYGMAISEARRQMDEEAKT